jgi:hypothetical protein
MKISKPVKGIPIPSKIGRRKWPPLSPLAAALKNLRPGFSFGVHPYAIKLQMQAQGIAHRWKMNVVTRRMPDGSLRVWRVK